MPDRNCRRNIEIDARTIDTRWLGERMDYSVAIDALLLARERSRQAAVP